MLSPASYKVRSIMDSMPAFNPFLSRNILVSNPLRNRLECSQFLYCKNDIKEYTMFIFVNLIHQEKNEYTQDVLCLFQVQHTAFVLHTCTHARTIIENFNSTKHRSYSTDVSIKISNHFVFSSLF